VVARAWEVAESRAIAMAHRFLEGMRIGLTVAEEVTEGD
jgi:hypothetical protein